MTHAVSVSVSVRASGGTIALAGGSGEAGIGIQHSGWGPTCGSRPGHPRCAASSEGDGANRIIRVERGKTKTDGRAISEQSSNTCTITVFRVVLRTTEVVYLYEETLSRTIN